jgi:hypothetical protein
MSAMRSEDLPRLPYLRRPNLESTLFARATGGDAVLEELREVREQLRRAERKLEAIESLDAVDHAAIRAVTTHTQLVCRASGYALRDADEPPPRVGDVVWLDGALFVAERLMPSPLPADPRRCAVLTRVT